VTELGSPGKKNSVQGAWLRNRVGLPRAPAFLVFVVCVCVCVCVPSAPVQCQSSSMILCTLQVHVEVTGEQRQGGSGSGDTGHQGPRLRPSLREGVSNFPRVDWTFISVLSRPHTSLAAKAWNCLTISTVGLVESGSSACRMQPVFRIEVEFSAIQLLSPVFSRLKPHPGLCPTRKGTSPLWAGAAPPCQICFLLLRGSHVACSLEEGM
jgi:hypothetical protein